MGSGAAGGSTDARFSWAVQASGPPTGSRPLIVRCGRLVGTGCNVPSHAKQERVAEKANDREDAAIASSTKIDLAGRRRRHAGHGIDDPVADHEQRAAGAICRPRRR